MKKLHYRDIHYETVDINTAFPEEPANSVLILYTGGTMGMVYNDKGYLVPFNFEQIMEKIPELKRFQYRLRVISFNKLIDSADVEPAHWVALACLIEENYPHYDAFLILHGTDTMAYSASALSYLLEGLKKPVIFTGAQLPIGMNRTDARENLMSALEIAAERRDGQPVIQDVCIYFNEHLLRGNRAKKVESNQFGAFETGRYPSLAVAGVTIEYNYGTISRDRSWEEDRFGVWTEMDTQVGVLTLFPGLSHRIVRMVLEEGELNGLILLTYGAGTAPTHPELLELLEAGIERGTIILNVSQCVDGYVMQGRYNTSAALHQIGVVGGADLTFEAAITKMMYLLGRFPNDPDRVRHLLTVPLRGEMN